MFLDFPTVYTDGGFRSWCERSPKGFDVSLLHPVSRPLQACLKKKRIIFALN